MLRLKVAAAATALAFFVRGIKEWDTMVCACNRGSQGPCAAGGPQAQAGAASCSPLPGRPPPRLWQPAAAALQLLLQQRRRGRLLLLQMLLLLL